MTGYLLKRLCALMASRRGATAIEYAVIAGVMITIIAAAFSTFGDAISGALSTIAAAIPA